MSALPPPADSVTGLDLERELSCSICTDILFQPLTLLDCLHTFCGGCLKEWFAWQAAAVTHPRRHTTPYTCPSCRESVRGTKADWRLTTMLESYLKANPDKGKTEEEKEESRKQYKPGDNVLAAPSEPSDDSEDSEDERLLANVRELSMAQVNSGARSGHRTGDHRHRRHETARSHATSHSRATGSREQRRPAGRRDTQETDRNRDANDRQVEHQPSLRSLLSGSEISSQEMQEEIVHAIYAEGLLDGMDVDNLTSAQEQALRGWIADAYRRRQRHRDRSRQREGGAGRSRSPLPVRSEGHSQTGNGEQRPPSQQHQQQSRLRPPISRPHLFEHPPVSAPPARRHHRRSASSSSQTDERQRDRRSEGTPSTAPAARSATDLSNTPATSDVHREHRRALSSSADRSATFPVLSNTESSRSPASPNLLQPDSSYTQQSRRTRRTSMGSSNPSVVSSPLPSPRETSTSQMEPQVRLAPSNSHLAPEAVSSHESQTSFPRIDCSRCGKSHIAQDLHYNCSKCDNGNFNICLECYRSEKGCKHWFGFGYMAMDRWRRASAAVSSNLIRTSNGPPHVLSPRRYIPAPASPLTTPSSTSRPPTLQTGAFCESCFSFANDCYWYCRICLEGAWGYCNACVLRGHHCTHPLLPVAHLSTINNPPNTHKNSSAAKPSPRLISNPYNQTFLPLPHLTPDSYLFASIPTCQDCDLCHRPIAPLAPRFHCYTCSNGDYDICTDCYPSLVARGDLSPANGPEGWRRCLSGHRMAIFAHENGSPSLPSSSSNDLSIPKLRTLIAPLVGGWRLKEDLPPTALNPPPPPSHSSPVGKTFLAIWSRFPPEKDRDTTDLVFPKNALITECEALNEDWFAGVWEGRVGVFPRNHMRGLG